MAQKIKRVAVLGAGVMGSGIAAHMAGVGLETLLLDIVPPELTEEDAAKGLNQDHKVFRNKFAATSLQKATKAKPPVFYNKQDVELIQVGNFDDDMARLADCDWIVEAVTESLPIKQKLFTAVDQHRKPGCLVTSNTSGLAIKSMVDGRSEDFARHFFVTHFFNPVRFMRLLELVKGEQTDQVAYDAFSTFGADVLGKGIVHGKDTPNFIANRLAMFGMSYALHVMERDGFNVQEIDAVFGPALARPKTAIFKLADLVGIDTLVHVINNCYDNLPDDDCRDYMKVPGWITEMVDSGKTSFYGGTEVQPQYYDLGKKDHVDLPLDERHIRLPALKEAGKVVKKNAGATIYDAGDGILLLEFHTKMNAVDNDIIAMMHETLDLAEGEGWNGVVVANEDKTCFSAGANLFAVLMAINQRMFDALETMIKELQRATLRMRQSDIPVVTAPAGLALGGGAEVAMAGDAIRAHAELYMGLVELGVGVIPAGGGCLEMVERFMAGAPDDPSFDPLPNLKGAFMNIGMAKVSVGAEEARTLGMLRPHDGITLNRDLLIHDAKQTALGMARAGYRRPRPLKFRLPGASGAAAFRWFLDGMKRGSQITEHEFKIASKLVWILCGGDTSTRVKVTQQHILDLEREAFLSLCGEPKTQERMQYMLQKNKPLRN